MKWRSFSLGGVEYDLSHLDPVQFSIVVPEKDGKPEQNFAITGQFGLHCFTKSPRPGEPYLAELEYSDSREIRQFCVDRHALSRELPAMVQGIGAARCFATQYENFYIMKSVERGGVSIDYAMFFAVSKAGKGGRLNLFVQSAYPVDGVPIVRAKPIAFRVIAHNVWTKRPIAFPK